MHNKLPAINELLERLVVEQPGIPDDLRRAMVYTLSAPGKRIRSMLVLWCCELVSGRENSNARIIVTISGAPGYHVYPTLDGRVKRNGEVIGTATADSTQSWPGSRACKRKRNVPGSRCG